MYGVGRLLAVAVVAVLAAIGNVSAQASTPDEAVANESYAQAEKPSVATRVKTWTRAKLEIAKKRWAADRAKFEDCQKQLVEQRKSMRMSIHKQGYFLDACMAKKP